MKSIFTQTRREKAGTIDGINLFFGALLGANLGVADRLPALSYAQLMALLAGLVVTIRVVSVSERRVYAFGTLAAYVALMMVVLTEWERDANLFRGRREHGSLRFLFLDEANRLSHDNLGTLFDLCKTLDLQLLIAAPEVARAEGNTTYRLVRTVTSDGREEVIVSGRRSTGEAAQA